MTTTVNLLGVLDLQRVRAKEIESTAALTKRLLKFGVPCYFDHLELRGRSLPTIELEGSREV